MSEIKTGHDSVQATFRAPALGRRTELDKFLFAPIGEEGNGMLLSVLSALARLDLDPWQEAATLTIMPTQDAAARLTCLLSSLPSCAANPLGPGTVARLIALLPRTPSQERRPDGITWGGGRSAQWIVAAYFIMAFIMMCAGQSMQGHNVRLSGESGVAEHSREAGPSPVLERHSATRQ